MGSLGDIKCVEDPRNDPTPSSDVEELSRIVLQNFTSLSQMGMLEILQRIQEENVILRQVIQGAKDIAKQPSILAIVETVAKILNDRLMPTSLTFILESDRGENRPDILHYQNMVRVDPHFVVEDLEPYRFFFNLAPSTVSFPVFEYMLGREELSAPFRALKPAVVMPILGFGQVYGFALIGEHIIGSSFSKNEMSFLEDVMQFASIGLQNNIHYLKAITDLKTRLYNHTYIKTRLEMELSRVRRYGHEIAVILTDVDHFKIFNDSYGHMAGDKMLMKIAEVFIDTIRKGDVAGRFGGEEFVVILAQCSRENACMVAERLRRRVEKILVEDGDRQLQATISLGVRHVTKESWAEADMVISQADKALYKSKETGRNRAYIYTVGKKNLLRSLHGEDSVQVQQAMGVEPEQPGQHP